MTTAQCALVVDQAAIPTVDAVTTHITSQGHTIVLPRGFSFSAPPRGPWVPITLDGTKTGFDYAVSALTSLAVDDPERAGMLTPYGSHLLDFGARGQDSVRALTVVIGAICALTAAHGVIEDEIIPASAMAAMLDGMRQAEAYFASAIAAMPTPTQAEQDAAFRALQAQRQTPQRPSRSSHSTWWWIALWIGAGVVGWLLAQR